ncbi:MAG TPA: ribonuclease H [Gemmatimonadales bacterium]|nr:ribonuclease H [Gemmatimonadales bacterium]
MTPPIAILHLDESCLGNGRDGATPGGAGGLVEARTRSGVQRRDFFLAEPDTTNNRMALRGATVALELLARKGRSLRVLIVSDSEYLVKGMRQWVPAWRARAWRRKRGAIENLELWQALVRAAAAHDVQWTWVRGHRGHPKNEYANDLAVGAAERGATSPGLVPSGFDAWLATRRKRGRLEGYDPDAAFDALARRLASAEPVPIVGAE